MRVLKYFIIIKLCVLSALFEKANAQVNIADADSYVCGGGTYTYAIGFLANYPIRVNRVSGGTYSVNSTNETITVTWNERFGSGYVEFIRPDDYGCGGPCGDDFYRYDFTEKRVDNISITKNPNINTIEFGQSITLTASLSGVHTSEFSGGYRWGLFEGTTLIHAFSDSDNQIVCTPSNYFTSLNEAKSLIFSVDFRACDDHVANSQITLNPPMPSVPINGFSSSDEKCEDADDGVFRITRMSLNGVSYSGSVNLPESVSVTYAYANGPAGTPPASETITRLPFTSNHDFSPESYSFYIRQANGNLSSTRNFTIDPGPNLTLAFDPASPNCNISQIREIIIPEKDPRDMDYTSLYQIFNIGQSNQDSVLVNYYNFPLPSGGDYVFRAFLYQAPYCYTDYTTFTNPATISLNTIPTDPVSCSSEVGSILAEVNYANGTASFTLTNEADGSTTDLDDSDGSDGWSVNFTNVSPGSYSVSVSHAGCSDNDENTGILINPAPRPSITTNDITTGDATCYQGAAALSVDDFVYKGENTSNLIISDYSLHFIIGGQSYYRDPAGIPYDFDLAQGGDNWQVQVIHSNSACGSNIVDVPQINDPEQVALSLGQIDSVRCYNQQNGSITVSSANGNTASNERFYTITPDINNVGTITTSLTGEDATFNNLLAGTYSITVTDGCAGLNSDTEIDIIVENYDEIIANPTSQQMSCHNIVDGSIITNASGGVGALDFEISPGGSRETGSTSDGTNYSHTFGLLDDLNSYSITVYDVNNCSNEFPADPIINPPPLQITSNINDVTDITCWNGSDGIIPVIAQGGTGQLSFSLENDNFIDGSFNAIDNNYSHTFTELPACDTIVYLTDDNGCLLTQDYQLSQPEEYIITNYAVTGANCYGGADGSISIQALGGTPIVNNYTYNLMDDNLSLISTFNEVSANFANLPFGNYYVDILDSRNCLLTSQTRQLSQPQEIIINSSITSAACYDSENITLTANVSGGSGSYIYTWRDVNDDIIGTNFSVHVIEGIYFVDVIDTDNCAYGRNTPGLTPIPFQFTAERPDTLEIDLEHLQNVDYNGLSNGSVSLSSEGGWSFHQYSDNGTDFRAMPLFPELAEGNHMFWVQDGSGCRDSLSVYISEPDVFVTNFLNKKNVNCFEGSDGWIYLNAEGGIPPYIFTLDDGSGNVFSQQSNTFHNLPAGNYTPSISYFGNDIMTPYTQTLDVVLINQPLTAVVSNITDIQSPHCSLEDGSATANVNGGTSPYTYLWSNGQTSASVNNFSSGNHFVKITDLNGCIDTSWIMLYDLDGPQLAIAEINNLPCFDSENIGNVTLTISGGTNPYNIQWDDPQGQTGLTASNLAAGDYSATVTDNEGCISILEAISITRPQELIAVLDDFKDPTCFNEANGELSVSPLGGTAPYSYQWQNIDGNPTTATVTGLQAGNYEVIIKDVHNCTDTENFNLINPQEIIIDLADSVFICQGQTATLDAGNMGSIFQWSSETGFNSDQQIVNVQEQGDYTIIVSNVQGCSNSKRIHIKHENRQLEGAFLLASEASMNDTIVLIEISWPVPDSVEWSIPDDFMRLTDGEAYKELIPLQTGEYTIGMKAYMADCQDIIEKTITIIPAGNLKSNIETVKSLIQEAKLFPNPNSGVFEVEVKLAYEADIRADLFSMKGMRMMPTKYEYSKKEYLLGFNLMSLQPGIYFVNIYAQNEVKKLKFVVN